MADDLRARAFALYKPPFKFQHGYIFDSAGSMVADQGGFDEKMGDAIAARVRGWWRIGKFPTPEQLQDKVGELLAEALNDLWERNAGVALPAEPQPCKRCHGEGCINEGDPEIGNAYFECEACGGTGKLPAAPVREMPPVVLDSELPHTQVSVGAKRTAGVNACPTCQGNDRDMPCAYPEGGQPGCLRDKRLGRTTACRGGSAAFALARTGGLCGTCKAEGLTTPACASGVREDGNGRR